MFCKSCGTQISDSSSFCPSCGTAISASNDNFSAPPYTPSYVPPQPVPTTPILVFGILSLCFACTFFLSFLGIIFGAISQSKSKTALSSNGSLSGKARTGRILGKVGLILGIVMTAIFAVYFTVILLALLAL